MGKPVRVEREFCAGSLQLILPIVAAVAVCSCTPVLRERGSESTEGPAAGLVSGVELSRGAVIRGPVNLKRIAFVFTGHEYAEGGEAILDTLRRRGAGGSFFLTGIFLRRPEYGHLIRRILAEGHYLGPHSDKHLLYCAWDDARTTLVSRKEFEHDLRINAEEVAAFERAAGKRTEGAAARFFLPPYEHYNEQIAAWTKQSGWTLVSFTPGTRSNADYTGEADRSFVGSEAILESVLRREREDPNGLSGFLLLLHIGAGPGRVDKFHLRFEELLETLETRGYEFVRIDELLSANLPAVRRNQTLARPR